MKSCVYRGQIYHKRYEPTEHGFNYSLDYFYLDLDEVREVTGLSKFISNDTSNLVSFKRQDYLPSERGLKEEVSERIRLATGDTFQGQVRLLATLRSVGYSMNPIALFYCFDQKQLQYIVAEVHNTPWNQRFVYVLTGPDFGLKPGQKTNKAFHVSPFMPMDTIYEWGLSDPQDSLSVSIKVTQAGAALFDASLSLQRIEITDASINGLVFKQVRQAFTMVTGIYLQALKLWLKKVPFYSHPDKKNIEGI